MKKVDPSQPTTPHIGMHLHGTARTDERVLREARALVAAGYAVTIVDNDPDATRPRVETFQGITLHHVRAPGGRGMRWIKRFKATRLAWLLVQNTRGLLALRAHAYHAHDGNTLLAANIAARVHRKPVIFDSHELPYVQRYFVEHRIQRRLLTALLRRLISRCAAVITVSPPIVDEIQARYGGPRAVVVRNVPVYHAPIIGSNQLRERLDLPPETRIALYQGGLQGNRSLETLVRAARYLPAGVVIVLMGNGESKPGLERLIAAEGVGERVRMIPAVPYAELLSWTASADLGLTLFSPDHSLSIRYCLPNKLFEYLMAGLPVLSSQLPAVAEVLTRYDVGWVCPSLEPEAVAGTMAAMLVDEEGLAAMRRRALAASADDLNWENEQTTLLRLYGGLLHVQPKEAVSELAH